MHNGGAISTNNDIYYITVIENNKVVTYKITATELQEIHSFKDRQATSADAITIGDTTYLIIERGEQTQKLFSWKNEDKLVRVRSTIEKLTTQAAKEVEQAAQPSLWEQFTTSVSETLTKLNPFSEPSEPAPGDGGPQMSLMSIPTASSSSDIAVYGTPKDNPYTSNHSFTYDDNGNLTSDGIQCYTYSEANRMIAVEDCSTNDLLAEYSYNDGGTRVRQKLYDAGTLIKTVYNLTPYTELTVHASDSTEIINYYYYVNDQLVARDSYEVGTPSSEQRFYYHQDHLDSTSVLTDSSGNVQESTEYSPYGGVLSGGTASKHQFTGQEYDHATGLNYYQSRYYNAYQRRFIQPDSIIPDAYDPQQLNPYAYVRNNPVKYVDPSGNIAFIAPLIDWGWTGYDLARQQLVKWNPNSTDAERQAASQEQTFILGAELTTILATQGLDSVLPGDDIARIAIKETMQREAKDALASVGGKGFRSRHLLYKHLGAAHKPEAWHHIVEQHADNTFRFGSEQIQNTKNVVKLPDEAGNVHRKVTGFYGSIQPDITGSDKLKVRDWIKQKSYKEQYNFGIDQVKRFGGSKYLEEYNINYLE